MKIPFKSRLQHLLRIDLALRFVWKSSRRWTIGSLLLAILQSPLELLPLYLMKLAIDSITGGLSQPDQAFAQIVPIIILLAVVTLITELVSLAASLVGEAQAILVGDYMEDIVHAKSISVDLEYYENPTYHDTLRRAQSEAPYRPLQILQGLTRILQSGLSLLAVAGLVIAINPGITLILALGVIPSFIVNMLFSGVQYRWQRERTETERQSWYLGWLLTAEHAAKEIRLFNLGEVLTGRYRQVRHKLRSERLRLSTRRRFAELAAETVTTATMYGAFAFIAYQTLKGTTSLGDLVLYYQAFQRGQSLLQGFLSSIASLYESSLFLTNLYEFLDLQPKITTPPNAPPVPRPMQTGITFENVAFSYDKSAHSVLQDVTLTIRPGEKIALVGSNGAGKTTLIKLLCRLYDPQGGRITLDGVDLRNYSPIDLRRQISVVLQDYGHYNLTALDNIWFGDTSQPRDEATITAAAAKSGADPVIAKLKNGYNTTLGKMFQQGEELSIGEWQKVALARAFFRDSQIVIMDEPTSSMDAQSEFEIFSRLRELTEGRSVILISHRFSTVRMADRIYVLDEGRIIEQGSHDELMAQRGLYARLFDAQASHYQ